MGASLALLTSINAERSTEQPNVILVVSDTTRHDAIGVIEGHNKSTPYIDKFSEDALVFERAYANAPWTLPSMCSIVLGQYPHEHLCTKDQFDGRLFGGIPEAFWAQDTLAESFKTDGYETAAFVNNTYVSSIFNFDKGFDTFDEAFSTSIGIRTATETSGLALDWMDARGETEQPFFMMVHYMDAHDGYDPEITGTFSEGYESGSLSLPMDDSVVERFNSEGLTEDERNYVKQVYLEEVQGVDRGFEALVEGLKERGLYENTIIVFTSDHGEEFWDYGDGKAHYGHRHTLQAALTHVPLIVRDPRNEQAGGSSMDVVDLTQLYPYLTEQDGAIANELYGKEEDHFGFGDGLALSCHVSGFNQIVADQCSVVDEDQRLTLKIGSGGTGMSYDVHPESGEESNELHLGKNPRRGLDGSMQENSTLSEHTHYPHLEPFVNEVDLLYPGDFCPKTGSGKAIFSSGCMNLNGSIVNFDELAFNEAHADKADEAIEALKALGYIE